MDSIKLIQDQITAALTGAPRPPKRWAVTGTNVRGEHFTSTYRRRYDAADFAAEVNGNGGDVRVMKVAG